MLLLTACGDSKDEVHPELRNITESVFASGTLEPENKYNLTALSDGYIIELDFKEGDVVKNKQQLARIDNQQNVYNEQSSDALLSISEKNFSNDAPALKQVEINIEFAKEKLKHDEVQETRFKKLLELNTVSKLEYENVKLALDNSISNLEALQQNYSLLKLQAQQQLISTRAQKNVNTFFSSNNKLKAVVGGMIYKKNKEIGDYVRKGDVIAVIGSADNLYARLNVDESNISKIKIGQEVWVQLNTNKGVNFNGSVIEILPAFEDISQSFICKVKFKTAITFKLASTQLQANIVIGKKEKALVIPRAYLDYGNLVRVKGKNSAVKVTTGFVSSEWVEVKEGLTSADIVLPIAK